MVKQLVDKKIKKDTIRIFTDGSFMKKKDGTKCGYGVHFPNNELPDMSRKFTYGDSTNQRAELYAIYKGIKKIASVYDFNLIEIYTDSEYSINSLTKWISGWKRNGWKNAKGHDIANQDIIIKIDEYMQKYPDKILFTHVRSHTGNNDALSKGNAIADKLATQGALIE